MLGIRRNEWLLGVVVPVALVVVILTIDYLEGPKTAFVGVLAVVPMLAAVFARPMLTAGVAIIAWLGALGFGLIASDGNVAAQKIRLLIIALSGLTAVWAAAVRIRRENDLLEAQSDAALAERDAVSDSLTGLLNRRGLISAIESVDASTVRTLALVDCDNLKDVNDQLGHNAGDDYLQAIAGRVRANLAREDLVARWGGDEFLIVQDLPIDTALPTLNRLRQAISDQGIGSPGSSIAASVSIGVAEWVDGVDFDDALAAADRALYRAKSQGRNMVLRAE